MPARRSTGSATFSPRSKKEVSSMVAKSIVDIDVNDDKFVAFMERFREYQSALDDLPEAWRVAAVGIGESSKQTEKAKGEAKGLGAEFNAVAEAILTINSGIDRLNANLEDSNKKQDEFNKKAGQGQGFINQAKKDAKELAGHIKESTASLLSWGGIVGIFTGVLGVGGLFGINRLAATTGAQRFTSLGLGTSIGALDSTAINYQKALGNPAGTLGAIRDSQMDLSKRWTFQAMGINNPDQDPAKLLPQMIRNARDIFVQNGSTLQGAQAHGLTNFFTLDDLNRFKNMSDEEITAMEKRAQQDARMLQITDQQARQWQDFNVQLDYSSQSIRNTFVRGLGPLTPQLSKLSDALAGAIDTVLKSPELGKWIDALAGGIERFGNYLASPTFKSDVESFMSGVERLGRVIMKVLGWLDGGSSAMDDIRSGSSFLNNDVQTDAGGNHFVKGGISDPNTPAASKWLARHLYSLTGTAPAEYDQYFLDAAKKYNVDPRWLKAIAAGESSWDQNAVSKAGAKGLMQVMPKNFQPGENPFDPRDNIMAGARVFKDGLDWASRNAGGDFDEALRYYNGGVRRGSAENMAYPGRIREKYAAMYGAPKSNDATGVDSSEIAKNTSKTNQLLQQIVDNHGNSGREIVVYNNTGGNAIVSGALLSGVR
ncbi:TPA: lytic transglycosylase domain-containing protein [Klebsiella pneumoniae]|uniref:lytic transglycosylase domain-containing protein n=2 Tax=Klebsiella pneumoniae TaxID=573 RepID=UPI00129DC398|nr:lytic transglycosylase domain-containing protein [Klebsiella pneumoniae]MBE4931149.1 lytic transglycosylase domain-containing protein [Klebsiella pneumoniae]QOU24447.1 lytic transglycosylase domain-containing protein [Klebsiella pneumoniae]HBT2543728.1 lytic transglycosylase domain-containing protein [Klebsiella pneumoniae]HBT2555156.1 lytic transglycosylase domain-containing protein [Klebsiella pneumoniae]HBT2558929.1 lytic transglycosylase domain-containing protein [Klebsiella pneumoniae]